MEHIMNPSALRKTQAICHFANALNDLKRTSKLWTKLATEARHQGLRQPMKKAQENPIVNIELKRAAVSIIMPFGIFLGLQQPIMNIGEKRVTIAEKLVHLVCPCRAGSVRQQRRWRPAIHHLKRRRSQGGVE